jgi:hypothetical protein
MFGATLLIRSLIFPLPLLARKPDAQAKVINGVDVSDPYFKFISGSLHGYLCRFTLSTTRALPNTSPPLGKGTTL